MPNRTHRARNCAPSFHEIFGFRSTDSERQALRLKRVTVVTFINEMEDSPVMGEGEGKEEVGREGEGRERRGGEGRE